jgi:proton-translocating NADH-quinone oxidoreductase chain M
MILTLIFLILFISLVFLFFVPNTNLFLIRQLGLLASSICFILSVFLLYDFYLDISYFQSLVIYKLGFDFLNLYFLVGLDGISLFFFILSSFLIFLCILFVWDEKMLKEYIITLLFLDLLLLIVFSILDTLLFYIFFEAILIPMYIMIGLWGSRERKIRAVYLFFFYTLLGSLCMLLGLLYIYSELGTLNYDYIYFHKLTFNEQYWLWLAFFLSFASKIPLFPFHLWLPEAHVEAPTAGSVLLAGILLKLGVYGFLRFNLNLFPEASLYFSPLVFILSILGIIYASMSALRQTDLKRIIAYSSVAHMNLVTMGIFSFNVLGIEGSIIQSISHGFVSGAMFLLVGILYQRYHSRFLFYYCGLTHTMPLYSVFFCLFTMANIALPGTSSFIGEFLLLVGIFKINLLACVFATLGVILCGSYSLWLYNRICFGNLNVNNTIYFADLNLREFFILVVLFVLVIFMGIYPKFFLQYINFACTNYNVVNLISYV